MQLFNDNIGQQKHIMHKCLRLSALIFSLFQIYAFEQDASLAALEYIKKNDAIIRGLLSPPVVTHNLSASNAVTKESIDWIKKIIRPDWLPENIESGMKLIRLSFPFIKEMKIDVLNIQFPFGSGRLVHQQISYAT